VFRIVYDIGGKASVQRIADGACIPVDVGNRDYVEFLAWNAKQATPLDVTDRAAPGPNQAEVNAKAARVRLAARTDFDKLPDWAQDICIALGLR
jgi:hypothetical protein